MLTETSQDAEHEKLDERVKTYPSETEAKWRLQGPNEQKRLRKLLKRLGGKSMGRHDEVNRLFDNAANEYERTEKVLRLRFINGEMSALLTLKGQAKLDSGTKQRFEIELEVTDGHAMEQILTELGFLVGIEYSKIREVWQFANTEVVIDELPFGYFCEIEGAHAEIKEVAGALSLDLNKCETRDYPTLMQGGRMGRLQKVEIDRITKYRKEGYTQAETAEKVGIHIKSVQKYDPLCRPSGRETIGLPQTMTTRDLVALIKTQGDLIDAALLTLRMETNAGILVCPKCLEGELDEENGVYTCQRCGYAMKLFANVWLDQ